MISYLYRFIFAAAFDLLPAEMASTEAEAMLLAIALQESGGTHRRQRNGPARGFWQFETGGVAGVLRHKDTAPIMRTVLAALCYPASSSAADIRVAIEHNDILACVVARLLLWTVPGQLPARDMVDVGWMQYLQAWRPGKPRPTDWPANFRRAWIMPAAGLDE